MKSTLTLLSLFLVASLSLTLITCSSSEYIYIKVKKSDLMPDSYELSRDSLIVGALRLCEMAQRFYNKPKISGGGGFTYFVFVIPDHLVKTAYGVYGAAIGDQEIKLYGTGYLTGFDGTKPMMVECIVSPNGITSTILN